VRKFYDQIEVMAYKIAAGNDVIISRAESKPMMLMPQISIGGACAVGERRGS
jgi:hypothetical protein